MYWKVLRLIVGLLCSYLAVNWMSVYFPFNSDDSIAELILNPMGFFAGTVALIIGMYANGGLLRDGWAAVLITIKDKKGFLSDIIFCIGSAGGYFLLLPLGKFETNVLYGLCMLYGMISLSPTKKHNK